MNPINSWPRLALLTLCLVVAALPAAAQTLAPDAPAVQSLKKVDLTVGKATLHTEVAATGAERERGLMSRTRLGDNDGMIFLMPRIETATFWMKNTLIPLSIAFIDKDGIIVDIQDMQPESVTNPGPHGDRDLPVTRSTSNQVAYALETNLHWFSLNGVKLGDKITPPPATLGKPTI